MRHIKKRVGLLAIGGLMLACGSLTAQEVTSPCPEVLIEQKYDHVGSFRYRQRGWDTVVNCEVRSLELSAEPYIPVQWFNGTYLVEQIPFNPPDTSFHGGTWMPITSDDVFCGSYTNIPYPFYFFGRRKTGFVVGSNGVITFDQTAVSQGCAWSMSATDILPWQRQGAHLNDAIFGIYEDTHPITSYTNNSAPLYQGIWYGIQGSWPCRKIIANWNDVPQYPASSNQTNRCTYQIVCYEGSNIIEVHVKKRSLSSTGWNGLRGIIGILDSTGLPQQPGGLGEPNMYVVANSPAAFFPAGYNQTTSAINTPIAFRFTPQGTTFKTCEWYRIFDDGREPVLLTTNQLDTNGYFEPMNSSDPDHPTLTKAYVSPTCVSRYVLSLKFKNANNDWYDLYDTITIGIDTAKDMTLKHPTEPAGRHEHEICYEDNTSILLDVPETQPVKRVTWSLKRILDNQPITLPQTMFTVSGDRMSATILPDPQAIDTLPLNKIDTLILQAFVEFESGCENYDTFMVRVYPNFDTTEVEGICKGDLFRWHVNNQVYSQTTNAPVETLHSVPGCDSVVHLDLTVYDVSLTIDTISDCKPVRWINGKTYYTTNTATYNEDTIVLPNRWGCDSVVRLDLTIHPLTARLESSLKEFDLDHLDVVLNDISTGSDGRRWVFPNGPEQTSPTAYYSVPASYSSANIWLIAHSPYGCVDSTNIIIPVNKETFWIPNIFTPDDPNGNNFFGSVSANTLKEEMFIYNRYGELVFHCEGVDCQWDGRDLNGQPCTQGAYAYIIRYNNTFEPTKTITRTGSVTLIR